MSLNIVLTPSEPENCINPALLHGQPYQERPATSARKNRAQKEVDRTRTQGRLSMRRWEASQESANSRGPSCAGQDL